MQKCGRGIGASAAGGLVWFGLVAFFVFPLVENAAERVLLERCSFFPARRGCLEFAVPVCTFWDGFRAVRSFGRGDRPDVAMKDEGKGCGYCGETTKRQQQEAGKDDDRV